MREYMSNLMQAAFGKPTRSREGCDWWELQRDGHAAVHICLNGPARPEVAHLLIFDPSADNNKDSVLDVSARTVADARAILERLKNLMCVDA